MQIETLTNRDPKRLELLLRIAIWMLVLLFFRVIIAILLQYQNYFPPNFESSFLRGREATFNGWYQIAFYAHILSGPPCLLIAAFLMFSGGRSELGSWHRRLGKVLAGLALLVMLPSGLAMSLRSFTGPIAGVGFAALSALSAGSIVIAARHAMAGRYALHQLWARRSFVFLCSPLLLRLWGGAMYVLGIESDGTYRFAAWASWLIPLALFELSRRPVAVRWFNKIKES